MVVIIVIISLSHVSTTHTLKLTLPCYCSGIASNNRAVLACLRKIKPEAELPEEMPKGMSAKVQACSNLAQAIKVRYDLFSCICRRSATPCRTWAISATSATTSCCIHRRTTPAPSFRSSPAVYRATRRTVAPLHSLPPAVRYRQCSAATVCG